MPGTEGALPSFSRRCTIRLSLIATFASEPTMSQPDGGTHRRDFLGSVAAGGGALLVGSWSTANAEVASLVEPPVADEWIAKITGKYRQVFDNTSPNEGFGGAFPLN